MTSDVGIQLHLQRCAWSYVPGLEMFLLMCFYENVAVFFPRKGYRTDATVSVFLGFLLFLIPAKKPCFGKRRTGEVNAVRRTAGTFFNV